MLGHEFENHFMYVVITFLVLTWAQKSFEACRYHCTCFGHGSKKRLLNVVTTTHVWTFSLALPWKNCADTPSPSEGGDLSRSATTNFPRGLLLSVFAHGGSFWGSLEGVAHTSAWTHVRIQMCLYRDACKHAHVRLCCTGACTHVRLQMCLYKCCYTHMHEHMCVYKCAGTQSYLYSGVYKCACTQSIMHRGVCECICTRVHVHMCVCKRVCTQI